MTIACHESEEEGEICSGSSTSLQSRLLVPVSMWSEDMSFEGHVADYKKLSQKFHLSNRYILLRHLEPRLAALTTREVSDALRAVAGIDRPSEVRFISFEDDTCVHLSMKTWKSAREAQSRLKDFLRVAREWLSIAAEYRSKGLQPPNFILACDPSDHSLDKMAVIESLKKLADIPDLFGTVTSEFTGPLRGSSTLWIGCAKLDALSDSVLPETDHFLFDLLRVFRHFGPISRYRVMGPRACIFMVYEKKADAIKARNSLFGFGVCGSVLNLDFSACEMCSGGVTVSTQLPFLSSTRYPLGSSFGGPVEGPEGEWKPSEVHVSDRLDNKGEQLLNDSRFLDILKQYDITVQSLHIYLTSVVAGGKVKQPRPADSSRRGYENYTSYKRPKEPTSPTSAKKRKLSESPSASTRDSPSPKNKEAHSTRRRGTASPSSKQVSPKPTESVLCSLSKRGQDMCKVRAHFIRGSSRLQPPSTVDIAVRAPFDRLLSHLKRVSKEQLNKRGSDPFGVWRISAEEGSEDGLDALTRYLQAKQRLGLVEGDPVVYLVPPTPEVCKQLLLTDDSSLFAFCLLE